MIPAAGQGILAVQARAGEYQELLEVLNDPRSEARGEGRTSLCKSTEWRMYFTCGSICRNQRIKVSYYRAVLERIG